MGGRNRAIQKQRNGWNQSPRRGQKFGSPGPRNDVTNNGLTLEEEARQTSSHHDWNSAVQLRKRPVLFVSSGSHDPLQPPTPQTENEKDAPSTLDIAEEAAPERTTPIEATPEDAAPGGATSEEATSEKTKPVEETPEEAISEHRKPVEETPREAASETATPVGAASGKAPFEEAKPVETTSGEATSEETKPVDLTAERTTLVEAKNGQDQDGETTLEQTTLRETIPEKEILEGVAPTRTESEEVAPEGVTPREDANDHPETDNTGSSDEVIVFKGRRAMTAKMQAPGITLTSIQTEIRAVEKEISAASEEAPKEPSIRPAEGDDDDSDDLLRPRRKRGKARGRRKWGKDSEEEAMLADYIANMRENGEMFEGLGDDDEEESSEDTDGTDDDDDIDGSDLPDLLDGPNPVYHVSQPDELEDDDYLEDNNEFDVMDWERPSVRRKKGKGGRLPFATDDLDSDLEETLRIAYNNDRHKKAERKKEREELRAKGLLGKRGQVDLRAKYPTGITMSQVIDEVKTFLAGSQETLSLPPMDPHTRKGVHELSHKLNIKSKSIGGGEQRRPVLYKTKKTSYNEREFDQVIARIRRIFGRQPPDKSDSRKNRQTKKGPKGSKPVARSGGAFDYHDGEVIGASAPELGTENRGRAMMEKMGWSTGTPLGSSDNQGILHPVSQTMKRTRAGLGQE